MLNSGNAWRYILGNFIMVSLSVKRSIPNFNNKYKSFSRCIFVKKISLILCLNLFRFSSNLHLFGKLFQNFGPIYEYEALKLRTLFKDNMITMNYIDPSNWFDKEGCFTAKFWKLCNFKLMMAILII